jgi:uncharacterized protein
VTLSVVAGASRLKLPVRLPRDSDAGLVFGEADGSEPLPLVQLEDGRGHTRLTRDPQSGLAEFTADRTHAYRLPDGLEYRSRVVNAFSIVEGDPLSATARSEREIAIARGCWRTRILVRAALTCDATTFTVKTVLVASEDDEAVLSRDWSFKIPRDHV